MLSESQPSFSARPRSGSLRLRILFLIDNVIDAGGAERFALGLATNLPRNRFEVWMCSTRRAEPEAVGKLHQAGVVHVNLGRKGPRDVRRFRALVGLLRQKRFDVLHSHMFGSNVWGAIIGRACGVPVIVAHEHSWSYSGSPDRVWIDREIIGRFATRFVAVSEADRARMENIERIPAEKLVMIPTAYVPHAVASSSDLRSELGLGPEDC